MIRALLLPLALLAMPAACKAERATAQQALPALTGRVVDQAELLSAQAEKEIGGRLAALETATRDQLVVVTLPDLGAETIEHAGQRLGNEWGIGQKDLDNGVLLIVAQAQSKVRIEVGTGLEGLLTDERAKAIIEERMIPLFEAGEYEKAIRSGVTAIAETLASERRRPMRKAMREAA